MMAASLGMPALLLLGGTLLLVAATVPTSAVTGGSMASSIQRTSRQLRWFGLVQDKAGEEKVYDESGGDLSGAGGDGDSGGTWTSDTEGESGAETNPPPPSPESGAETNPPPPSPESGAETNPPPPSPDPSTDGQTGRCATTCKEIPFQVELEVTSALATVGVYVINITRLDSLVDAGTGTGEVIKLPSLKSSKPTCKQTFDSTNPQLLRIRVDDSLPTVTDDTIGVMECGMSQIHSWRILVNGAPAKDAAFMDGYMLIPLTFIAPVDAETPYTAGVEIRPPALCDSGAVLLGSPRYSEDERFRISPMTYGLVWPETSGCCSPDCVQDAYTENYDPVGGGSSMFSCYPSIVESECTTALTACRFATTSLVAFARRNPLGCRPCSTYPGVCGRGTPMRYCCALG